MTTEYLWAVSQWIPPTERARAVSLTTSGMYLGSAGAMLWLPGVAARAGARALLRLVGCMGLAWLLAWRLTNARLAKRCADTASACVGTRQAQGSWLLVRRWHHGANIAAHKRE